MLTKVCLQQSDSQAALRFTRQPVSLTIILGSEAPPSRGRPALPALASDEEEETCSKDEFLDIDNLEGNTSLVVGGSFSSSIGRIKAKRVKGKES
jgi:hypothetical protein